MSAISHVKTRLFKVPLPQVLSDAKHGDRDGYALSLQKTAETKYEAERRKKGQRAPTIEEVTEALVAATAAMTTGDAAATSAEAVATAAAVGKAAKEAEEEEKRVELT